MQPDYEGMSKFAAIIEQFKEVTYGDLYNSDAKSAGKGKGKRPNAAAAGAKAPNKGKKKKNEDDADSDEEEKKVVAKKKPGKKRNNDEESKTEELDMSMGDVMDDRRTEEDEDLKNRIEDGTISRYTMPQLKDILRVRRLKIGKGTKEELIETLKNYLKI